MHTAVLRCCVVPKHAVILHVQASYVTSYFVAYVLVHYELNLRRFSTLHIAELVFSC